MEKKTENGGGALNNILAKNSKWNGTLKAEGGVRIDGEYEGSLNTNGTLVVGKDGLVKAEVHVKDAIIGGTVVGNVTASNKIELQSGASLTGDVKCRGLIIDNDVFFEGSSKMAATPEQHK
jgi:cytoskeletal protein CcmA (bactofilin family)